MDTNGRALGDNTLFDQLTTMVKAHSYDLLSQEYEKLKEENTILKERVKFLEDLIKTYTDKMLQDISILQH